MPCSFFTYSPRLSEEVKQKRHVLFHANKSEWLVVNDTGLEIAKHLDRGPPNADVAGRLVSKYRISAEEAEHDVLSVSKQLDRQHFLNGKKTKRSARYPTLNSAYLHLTSRCNLSCPHCYVSSSNDNTKKDLPATIVLKLIDELANNGGQTVTLSGGEPLLHPAIKKILKYAAPKVGIRLLSNGTLIDKEWAAFLADMDIFIQISVDGSQKEIHDLIRGEGSFENTLRGVECLQEAGLGERINFSTTVMNQNIHDLKEIISLAKGFKVPLVRFLPLHRMGRAKKEWDSIGSGITISDYEQFYQYTSELRAEWRSSIEISCGLSGFLLKIPEAFSEDDIWCPLGKQLVVGANGDTFPCDLMMSDEFKVGNIFHDSLTKMIQSDKMKMLCQALSDRRVKIKKCAACNWRNLCQAGCMGQALEHKRTLWDTDDFCDYRKRVYEEAFDKILGLEFGHYDEKSG
ncbi:MAG: radical SAM protein [Desulfobacteraceae bacterium]|nr:radical SAM protein [Desulfobacteraceae bacterium]MBC2757471.1 radical SAM protein [Desulfobacteraceae bacterium]